MKKIITPWIVFLLLIGGLGFALSAQAQEPNAPDGKTEETAEAAVADSTPAVTNGGEQMMRFLFGRLGEFIKTDNLFQPEEGKPEGDGEEEDDGNVTLNFNNTDINQVLKFISDLLKKPLLKSDGVKGKFTLMMPEPLPKEEALRRIETVLAMKNFTLFETDGMLMALTVEEALKAGINVETGEPDSTSSRLQRQIVSLKFADAVRLKEALTPLFPDPNRIIAEPRTNQLIITDSGVNIARYAKIIEQLDREDEGTRIVTEIVKINYGQAKQLQSALEGLLGHLNAGGLGGGRSKRGGPGGGGGSGLTTQVFADQTTNNLIISGPAPNVKMVIDFVKELDTSTSEGTETVSLKLQHANAQMLAAELSELMRNNMSGARRSTIVADQWTNTLLVTGLPEDVELVTTLVTDLDHVKISERDTRVFVLEHADAVVLSEAIKEVLGEGDGGNRGGYYSYYYSSRRRGGGDDDEIKIYEDLRLNALIISAKVEDFGMIEELLDTLDSELAEGKEEPRVYPLEEADASSVAAILQDLFEDNSNSYRWWDPQPQSSVSALAGKVRVIADPTTNSLVVIASTPRAFAVVEGLLKKLDRVAEFGSTIVVTLKNASAADLATYLNELFKEDTQGGNSGGRGSFWFLSGSAGGEREVSSLIGNVRIVAEPRTNSLLVTTRKQNFTAIKELVEDLDQATAQVLVEILIVEMSAVDQNNLGIQWGAGGTGRTTIDGDLNGNYQNFPDLANSPLNRFNYSTLSTSQFGVVLNYLASEVKSNVIARPNIMTSNNVPAIVRLQQSIPYLEDVNTTSVGTTFSTDYKEVGLVLSVTPQINMAAVGKDEQRVTLDVTLINGEVLEGFNTIDVQGVQLTAFSEREVSTFVTVNNGMTVVLSGVLDEAFVDTKDGVPFLRSVPLLGGLFRSRGKRVEKTELLTFITPYILTEPEQLEAVTQKQMRSDAYTDYLETHNIEPDEILSGTTEVNVAIPVEEDTAPKGRKRANKKSKRGAIGR